MYSKEEYTKKIEERKINIIDLLEYLLRKWKKIAFFSLLLIILMFIFLSYKYLNDKEKKNKEEITQLSMEDLSEIQKIKLNNVLDLHKEIKYIDDYKKKSALMQLNAMESKTSTIQYYISASTEEVKIEAYELYINYLKAGAFNAHLENELGKEIKNPVDIIEIVYDLYDIEKGKDLVNCIFTVEINAPNEDINKRIIEFVKEDISDYQKTVINKLAGEHKLLILSENGYTQLSSEIQAKQERVNQRLLNAQQELTVLESQLTTEEKEVLEYEETGNGMDTSTINKHNSIFIYSPSFLIFVFVVSILVVIAIFCVLFLMNNTIKSEEEIEEIFDIPCFEYKKRKQNEDEQALMKAEFELMCKSKRVKDVYISHLEKKYDGNEIDCFFSSISSIDVTVGKNICENILEMEKAKRSGNIICVLQSYETTYDNLKKVIMKCEQLNINIMGMVIV